MTIEEELIAISKFKPRKDYKERQDYLAALANAVLKVSDKAFEELTNAAQDWANNAAAAVKSRHEVPEFTDGESDQDEDDGTPLSGEPDEGGTTEATPEAEAAPALENEFPPEGTGTPVPPPAKPKKPKKPRRNLTGEFDRYGVAVGTRAAMANAMFEKGATMREVKEALGDSKYNVLRERIKSGHRVTKDATTHKITLTHKDDAKPEGNN